MAHHFEFRLPAALCLFSLIVASNAPLRGASSSLSVLQAGVQRSEDAPFVPPDFQFLPGDYVYFTFQISGFATASNPTTEAKSFSLEYEVTPRDEHGVPLTPTASGKIAGDLGSEDKNWTPKRRASFLLPSYVAAGKFYVHVAVRDQMGKSDTSADYPFQMGGVVVKGADSVRATDFDFFRNQEDATGLELPAFAAGDTVWARFNMTGFRFESGSKYRLSYGLTVLRPDGKVFLSEPNAAQVAADSFYPAQFVPGELQITTPKDAQHGSYLITLTIHDQVANQSFDLRRTFTVE